MLPLSVEKAAHPLPWEDGPYSVKRHGVTLTNCDSEPVQTPGCIQAHGVLLVVDRTDLTILQVTENAQALVGVGADALLGRPVAAALGELGEESQSQLRAFLDRGGSDENPLYVLTLPARPGAAALDVTVHTLDDVAIVELEATGRSEGVVPDPYAVLKTSVARLQRASSVVELSRMMTDEVRAVTGFDRVMVYRFHPDGHGEVFAESRIESCAPWLGLHYPAEDIPRPAREVFKKVWCRPVPDIEGGLAELVPLVHPRTKRPLTMTQCALRGPSIMYTEYLRNMGVTACLTMPIRRDGDLWGLIACHHYAGPKAVPYQIRAACELIAQVGSLHLQATEDREHVLYRLRIESVHNDLIAHAAQEAGLATLMDGRPGILGGLNASGAALFHQDRWWKVGDTPTDGALDELARWLMARPELEAKGRRIYATDALAEDYPGAPQIADKASGVLAFGLARGHRDLVMWFRPETIRDVSWAGDPNDKPTVTGPHGPRLTPRASFELFRESVRGRSLPWLNVEVDAAARLRVLVLDVIVGRAEQLAELNAELTRSNEELDAFAYAASHDLKEPLRGIHRYAEQLLEDATVSDAEHRRKLEALTRLTSRMDSLLDSLLQFSRVGRIDLLLEDADLDDVVREALEMISSRMTSPGVEVVIPRRLPVVRCDCIRVREVFMNLLSNALKYNDQDVKVIEIGYLSPAESSSEQTIFFVKDNGIGIAAKHFDQVFQMFRRLHGRAEFGGGSGAGLTIVQRVVERHHGRIWIESTLGVGSTFFFTLGGERSP
jgi:chemotaxis family two-component system sensor kinase Cph1